MMFWIGAEIEAGSGVPNLMTCSCQSGIRVVGIGEDLFSQRLLEMLLLQRALLHLVWNWLCSEEETQKVQTRIQRGFAKQSLFTKLTHSKT